MVSKLKPIIFFALLLVISLVVVNLFFFSSLPDHFLTISSADDFHSQFIYSFFSLFAFFEYYVGAWILFPSFSCLIFLLVFYESNKVKFLTFSLLFLSFFFLLVYSLFPSLLGAGLLFEMKNLVNSKEKINLIIVVNFILIISLINPMFIFNFFRFIKDIVKLGVEKFRELKSTNRIQENELITATTGADRIDSILDSIDEKPAAPAPNFFEEEEPKSFLPDFQEPVSLKLDVVQKDDSIHDKKKEASPISNKEVSFEDYSSSEFVKLISSNSLLNKSNEPQREYFQKIINGIESKLAEFKITAKVINILKGPVVDTFELELGAGIKVSKVTNLTEDLGLALFGVPIRMVYPMKGKATIGIEVPRNPRDIIYLDDVLKSETYTSSSLNLPLAMGKNAYGDTSVVDLSKAPHMLVAGATGAGKSVFVNNILVSLIIKKDPTELKLLLIDPKQLELALYQELPHLVLPVVTDHKMALAALLWCVDEMERRYTLMRELGVKDIGGFNKKIKNSDSEVVQKMLRMGLETSRSDHAMPYLVVVVDEFADLILTKSGKDIETNISRLAAKARASGIHIILATQRPSTDVITGVIKSNFPTRVSFRVTSSMDSRVVLDVVGAEKLLGRGDMLYKQGVELMRLHSAYVDEEEIERLVGKLSHFKIEHSQKALDFIENIEEEMDFGASADDASSSRGSMGSNGQDKLFEEAVKVVLEQRAASASMLQRRLRVGYNRAANLIEEMESRGIVGPQQGSKPRKVLGPPSSQE